MAGEISDCCVSLSDEFLLDVPVNVLSNFVFGNGVLDGFSGDKKEKPIVKLEETVVIKNEGSKVVIKNFSFKAISCFNTLGEIRSGIGKLFEVKGDVEFENCDFENRAGLAIVCKENSNVSFKNCSFKNLCTGIETLNKADVFIENCIFNNIEFMALDFCDDSTFKICKTNFNCETIGTLITEMNNASGTIEECSFNGNGDKNEKGICILAEDNCKLGINKSSFSKVGMAIGCGGNAEFTIVQCDFNKNVESIGVLECAKVFMSECKVRNNFGSGVLFKDNCDGKIFECEFANNKKHGIQMEGNCSVRIYESSFHGNKATGINQIGNAELVLRDSVLYENVEMGLYSHGNCTGSVAHSKFYNNRDLNVGLMDNGNMIYEDNEFFYNWRTKGKIAPFCFYCNNKGKAHFDNCKFYSKNKESTALILSCDGEIFAENCSFDNLNAIAVTLDKSKLYLTDSYVDNLVGALSFSDGGPSEVSNYGCNFGKNFEFLKNL